MDSCRLNQVVSSSNYCYCPDVVSWLEKINMTFDTWTTAIDWENEFSPIRKED